MVKPKNIVEYKKWLKDNFAIEVDSKMENHYNSVVAKLKSDFQGSPVWTELLKQLEGFNNEYLATTTYQLFLNEFKPILVTKSFNSFIEKAFRRNIVFNKSWPNPPNSGWLMPDNWFENTNDILRTYFVVKYLDGVDFFMDKMEIHLKGVGLPCNTSFEARDEGYYAVHIYTQYDFEIPKPNWDTEKKKIQIEFQITTQLQDVIGKLTHQFYENRRIIIDKKNKKWQWNYNSEEFTANYLGHILHYVEGMIMDVRNKQLKK